MASRTYARARLECNGKVYFRLSVGTSLVMARVSPVMSFGNKPPRWSGQREHLEHFLYYCRSTIVKMSQMFSVNTSHPMPLYAQLERTIRFAVATGKLREGDQLPTVRQLAVDLRINANTVAKVYAELERSGVVETRRGVGTFVSARHFKASSRQDHNKHLRHLADRFIAEAEGHGFSADDLIDHLQSRRKRS